MDLPPAQHQLSDSAALSSCKCDVSIVFPDGDHFLVISKSVEIQAKDLEGNEGWLLVSGLWGRSLAGGMERDKSN